MNQHAVNLENSLQLKTFVVCTSEMFVHYIEGKCQENEVEYCVDVY